MASKILQEPCRLFVHHVMYNVVTMMRISEESNFLSVTAVRRDPAAAMRNRALRSSVNECEVLLPSIAQEHCEYLNYGLCFP